MVDQITASIDDSNFWLSESYYRTTNLVKESGWEASLLTINDVPYLYDDYSGRIDPCTCGNYDYTGELADPCNYLGRGSPIAINDCDGQICP